MAVGPVVAARQGVEKVQKAAEKVSQAEMGTGMASQATEQLGEEDSV